MNYSSDVTEQPNVNASTMPWGYQNFHATCYLLFAICHLLFAIFYLQRNNIFNLCCCFSQSCLAVSQGTNSKGTEDGSLQLGEFTCVNYHKER